MIARIADAGVLKAPTRYRRADVVEPATKPTRRPITRKAALLKYSCDFDIKIGHGCPAYLQHGSPQGNKAVKATQPPMDATAIAQGKRKGILVA